MCNDGLTLHLSIDIPGIRAFIRKSQANDYQQRETIIRKTDVIGLGYL